MPEFYVGFQALMLAESLCCDLEQGPLSAAYERFNPGMPVPVWLNNFGWDIKNQTK